MRHNVAHRKLGRVTEHRLAMLRNQAMALLRHERIETTMPKAKELRPFVERLITIAKRGVASGANGRTLHARRLVLAELQDREVVAKLFDTLAPRFAERPGGYTRILRMVPRPGDSAPMALMQLVEGPAPVAAEEPAGETKKKSTRRAKAKPKAKSKTEAKTAAAPKEAAPAKAPKKRTRKKKVAAA